MNKGPMIGGLLLALAAAGVVGFYLVMSGGGTGDIVDVDRQVHQVEDVEAKSGTADAVVGTRPAEPRPEDPVAAKLGGTWDTKAHGELTASDWDEIKAVQGIQDRQVMESVIETFMAPLSIDKAKVREAFETVQIQQEAVNTEVREGYLNPRQARKKHEAIRKQAEAVVVAELGEDKAAELKAELAKKMMRFY